MFVCLTFGSARAATYYVTVSGAGAKTGADWANALDAIQLSAQVLNAQNGDVFKLAAGTYKPYGLTREEPYLRIRTNIKIYGGYTIGTETRTLGTTIFSGDTDDDNLLDGDNFPVAIYFTSVGDEARLDGVDITLFYSTSRVASAIFIFTIIEPTSPIISNCSIYQNYVNFGATVTVNASFSDQVSPTLINCQIRNNQGYYSGGVWCYSGNGGGYIRLTLLNCTFVGNQGSEGGAVTNGEGLDPFEINLTNCIVWGNSNSPGPAIYNNYGITTITHSDIQDVTPSGSIVSVDPQFVDAAAGNYRLQGCSPLVNQGSTVAYTTANGPDTDLAGNNRLVGTIDMGAYEFQNSLAITGGPASASTVCPGSTVSVPVSATSAGSISYQWFKEGNSLGELQTSATLSLTNVQASDAGNYKVVVTSDCQSLTSTAFSLSISSGAASPVLSVAPAVTQPILQNTPSVTVNIAGCAGGTVNWSGSNATSGTGPVINVPTTNVTSIVYSATCTLGSCASQPGSTTVTISPPLVSGSFDGFVYGADCSTFRGWAWDRNKGNTAVSVDILDGATVLATLLADVFRQDLQTAGKGNGKHAFSWTIPESLKDGLAHNLSARVSGSGFILKDSPKALICQGSSTPTNKAPVPPSPTVLIAPLAAQVNVPFSGTLVAFTDPESQPLTYALSGLPDGLSINTVNRVISGTPTVAGTFVLAYSASDGTLINSVSFPLTVNPASTTTVTGSFEGYLDKVECGTIRGWVWDRNKPNTPVSVEFYAKTAGGSETVVGSTVANIFRQDLKDAGKGNGAHAYSFEVPNGLKDGQTRAMYGRVLGSTYVLKDSGKPLTCNSPTRLSAETGPELQVTVLGNPVSDQLRVEIRGVEGRLVRLQLTDASGRLITLRQIEAAKAVEQQTVSVQGNPSGLLLLRVESGQKQVTLKVLKP
ncbi:hypothetical protein GCM10028804_56200 [Larkinella terrae]